MSVPDDQTGANQKGTVPFSLSVVVLDPLRLAGFDGQRLPHFADQLLVGLVHADHRPTGIVGSGIDVQNVFHADYECGVGPGWDPPILLPMRLKFVFLDVLSSMSMSWSSERAFKSLHDLAFHMFPLIFPPASIPR